MTGRVEKENTEAEFELEGQEAFEFWAVAARLNFMAQDLPRSPICFQGSLQRDVAPDELALE